MHPSADATGRVALGRRGSDYTNPPAHGQRREASRRVRPSSPHRSRVVLIQGRLLTDPASPPSPGWVRTEGGRIAEVGEGAPPRSERPDVGGPDAIISPAFVDAHLHIPQFDSVGCDGMPLLEWLHRVVFPAETWWGVGGHANITTGAIRRLVRQGTFAFAGYLTSHAEASRAAIGMLERSGLRCAVGRVAMDREAPEELTREDRWRASQRPTPSPVLEPHGFGRSGGSVASGGGAGGRVEASANPRFAIACSEELLAEIGWLARERPSLVVQTHLAESRDECARVRELFPDDAHYTGVYDRFGLLRARTILAHCCHLAPEEWALIAERGAVIAHCPGANVFLRAGLFDLNAARDHGVRIALGSDVAAGPDVAMPRVARAMIEVAKSRAMCVRDDAVVPTPAEAWEAITRGNADALGWADAGRIEPGASADLLALRVPETWRDENLIGRLLYNWDDSLIAARVLAGRIVDPDTI
ncbi:MAG: hypothetical protein EA379_11805 [Phycisphaerales bacterium]|nr:MAG: hypothetical protein EA379_11805 [Phycisphaerales bacterium]